ncbi:WD40 repeat-like protein [Coemansia erecta]|uniref:WD40 repeat-like protein n=1 Tax=Coemansia erecta TaxID=147472 RepID=A0A9W7Y6K1_9FUNG|nr:WD40 repeat-like protein [Coemansia erecta]
MSYTKESFYAPAPMTERGHSVRLTADPSGTQFVYASGKTIIIRSLTDLTQATEYTGHTQATTMARFSPSGYYVASGDVQGNVRIWDAVGEEQRLKSEFRPISERVNDIAWDSESQRVMAVGAGNGRFGHVFLFDSGNTVGSVEGHAATINACTMRQQRPFRAATCSDDGTCVFYHGAPYRLNKVLSEHTGFVHDVRYAPSDEYFASAGADGRLFLYDGKTGELVRQVAKGAAEQDAHKGSIFALAWSPDSRYVVTAGGDGTCRFWDVAEDRLAHTVHVAQGARAPEHQQVGVLWTPAAIVSLSLSGDINELSMQDDAPVRVVTGHQRPITAAAMTGGQQGQQQLYTASYDGKLCRWDWTQDDTRGVARRVEGAKSGVQVDAAAAAGQDHVALAYMDGTLCTVASDGAAMAQAAGLGSGARSLAVNASGTCVAALTDDTLVAVRQGQRTRLSPPDTTSPASAVAFDQHSGVLALGFMDMMVRMYTLDAELALVPAGRIISGHQREPTALAFSPDGRWLASGDAQGKIIATDVAPGDGAAAMPPRRWGRHTARIYALAWAPDSVRAASASLDGHVYVWSTAAATTARPVDIPAAHVGGVRAVFFPRASTVVSAGADGGVKVWTV